MYFLSHDEGSKGLGVGSGVIVGVDQEVETLLTLLIGQIQLGLIRFLIDLKI